MSNETTITLPPARNSRYGRMLAEHFQGDVVMPSTSEVVVIGGGIMGIAAALSLAKRGVQVVVIEKAEIACEASSRAFGWVSEMMIDPIKQPMTQLSKRLWGEWQAQSGDLGFRRYGLANLASTEEDMGHFDRWLQTSRGLIDNDTRVISKSEVAQRFPSLVGDFKGALFAPSDGSSEPTISTTRLAQVARRAGVRIVTDCAVRGVDRKGGSVAGVFTEKGYVNTSNVVLAVNTWSRLFLGNLGIELPQIYVTMSMGRTTETDGPVGAGGPVPWSWRRQIDGGYTLGGLVGVKVPVTRDAISLRSKFKPLMEMLGGGKLDFGYQALADLRLRRRWSPASRSPFEQLRVLTGNIDAKIPPSLLNEHKAAFPEMRDAELSEMWCGPIPITPDNKPVIGPVDDFPGMFMVSACSYGISWAPAVGQVLAEMVVGAELSFDCSAFRLARFRDGSALELAH